MKNHQLRKAVSLLEIAVVAGIIAVLSMILLPAIQAARESSRRSVCQSNLRQVGMALQGHAAVNHAFPIGAASQKSGASKVVTMGTSWWVEILDYLEASTLADQLDMEGANSGSILAHKYNGQVVDKVVLPTMHCPSSSFPTTRLVGEFEVGMPSYQGIAGAASDDGFPEERVSICCVPKNDGQISAGGALVSNYAVHLSYFRDGLTHTLAVGETSDVCFTENGEPWRVDGGFPYGWLAGTKAVGTAPHYDRPPMPPSWNITSIRYQINESAYELPGIDNNRGPNNPLRSIHPQGVNGLWADGSVRFCTDDTEVNVLKRMATRDDAEKYGTYAN